MKEKRPEAELSMASGRSLLHFVYRSFVLMGFIEQGKALQDELLMLLDELLA